jgi:hypothetical protein
VVQFSFSIPMLVIGSGIMYFRLLMFKLEVDHGVQSPLGFLNCKAWSPPQQSSNPMVNSLCQPTSSLMSPFNTLGLFQLSSHQRSEVHLSSKATLST